MHFQTLKLLLHVEWKLFFLFHFISFVFFFFFFFTNLQIQQVRQPLLRENKGIQRNARKHCRTRVYETYALRNEILWVSHCSMERPVYRKCSLSKILERLLLFSRKSIGEAATDNQQNHRRRNHCVKCEESKHLSKSLRLHLWMYCESEVKLSFNLSDRSVFYRPSVCLDLLRETFKVRRSKVQSDCF